MNKIEEMLCYIHIVVLMVKYRFYYVLSTKLIIDSMIQTYIHTNNNILHY